MTLRTVGARLTLEIGEFQSKLKAAGQSTRDFKGELDKAAKGGHLEKVADRAGMVGLAMTGMAAYAIKAAADFDKAMSAVAAATHAPVGEINQLRAAAIQAGKDTQYSATEAAQGITELSKAGVSTANILNGGLKGALALAAAGQLGVGEAAETAASALTQFKLSGSQVPHVADLLAAAAGKAQGSVHDVGQALNQSGLVAAQFGLSIEDTVGALAEFASAGLTGSDAGTSFKTMLLAIANPSLQTRNLMNDLGISFYDAQGKFIGISGVAQVLQTRLKGLTDAQRQQALGQLFGNDAIRSASILYTDGAKGAEAWKKGVNEANYSTDTAAKLTDNLAGDLERLKGSVETLAIESGTGANGGLRVLAKSLNALVDGFSNLPSGVSSTVTILAGVGGAALLAGAGWVKLRKSTANVVEELRGVGPMGVKAATGLQATTKWAGRASLAFAAMQIAGAAVDAVFGDLNPQTDALGVGLKKFSDSGQVTGEAARLLGDDMGKLDMALKDVADTGKWSSFSRGAESVIEMVPGMNKFDDSLANSKERLSAVDQALQGLVAGGHADQAAAIFSTLADRAKKQGVSVKELKAVLPGYSGAVEAAGSASKGAAGKLGDLNSALQEGASKQNHYKTTAEAVAGAARGERAALQALSTQLKADTDPVFALIEAQKGLKQAQKEATKATKDHGAKSGEARAANLRLAQAALELQAANGNLTTSFNGKLSPAMRDTLEAAGLTKGEIKSVEGQFKTAKTAADKYSGKYAADASAPGARTVKGDFDKAYASAKEYQGKYEAQVSAPGAKQSKIDIDHASTSANGFSGPYIANLSVTGEGKVNAVFNTLSAKQQALKNADTFARFHGGYSSGGWTGPGSKYEPAGYVHGDEFVVQKDSRGPLEQAKPGALDYMNRTGRWPAEGDGGGVLPFRVDASKTKIPQLSALLGGGAGPGGGQTYKWILEVVHKAFPGLHATSTFRRNAVTLSGNRSYHAVGRAVDWPPSMALAEWVNGHYGHATRELITPWNSLNIKNGRRHAYSGEIFAQHAGLGRWKGNAHDHWAMAHGGVIPEHVVGVGRSGRTYEFGEAGPERVTPLPGYAGGGYVNVAPSSSTSTRSGTRLDYYDSLLSATNAVAQFTAALKENRHALSTRTQKGRDDRAALISGVRAAQEAAKARYEETGSIKAANKVYDEYIRKLDAAMKKMHVNTKTRREMIKAYSEKPKYDVPSAAAPSNSSGRIKSVQDFASAEEALSNTKTAFAWTKPTFSGRTETGRSELQTLFTYLGAAEQAAQSQYAETGNASSATKLYNSYLAQLRAVLARSGMSKASIDALFRQYGRITLTRNRWGGVYQHAAGGALSEAQIAPGGPTRYAWAESSTGGELFAPKHGNLQKTRAEVGWAVANWWGGNVNWGGQGGGARHITVDAPIAIQLGADTIVRQVRIEVDTALGQVATAVIHQSA